jgi:hypothetical protein
MGKARKMEERYHDLLSMSEEQLRELASNPKTRTRIQKFLRERALRTFNKRLYSIERKHPNKPGRSLNKPNMKNYDGRGGI